MLLPYPAPVIKNTVTLNNVHHLNKKNGAGNDASYTHLHQTLDKHSTCGDLQCFFNRIIPE